MDDSIKYESKFHFLGLRLSIRSDELTKAVDLRKSCQRKQNQGCGKDRRGKTLAHVFITSEMPKAASGPIFTTFQRFNLFKRDQEIGQFRGPFQVLQMKIKNLACF